MSRRAAALGSAVFFVAAPGVVAGLVPWWLTGWHARHTPWLSLRVAGTLLIIAGVTTILWAFEVFVTQGHGTPAPIAPTQRLVVAGPYRHVRNPMYLQVLAAIIGQALALSQPARLAYAAVIALAVGTFVIAYEQPTLTCQFGPEYETYRHAVRAWWPRRRRWHPSNTPQR